MVLVKKVRKLGARGGFAAAQRETSTLRPLQRPKVAPCVASCPNGTDVRGALTSIARAARNGRSLDEALDRAFYLIAERNPLPALASRICPHHCEDDCYRAGYDAALSINQVERYLAQRALARAIPLRRSAGPPRPERVAVIGAGATAWSLAYQLARRGYQIAVFDQAEAAANALQRGLPQGLVPDQIIDAEVRRLLDLGIEFRREPAVNDPAWVSPQDESFARTIRTRLWMPGHTVDPASIVPAISYGRRQAEVIDAELSGRAVERASREAPVARDRIKFDYYAPGMRLRSVAAPAAATGTAAGAAADEETSVARGAAGEPDEAPPLAGDEILAEAERCLSCGDCWDCDNCYKYCPEQAVAKPLEPGLPYRFKLDFCNGCGKCADECPCGYVDMV